MGVEPSQNVWLVGDTWGDVACANEAGLTSVLVSDGVYDSEHKPALHLPDCAVLLDYIRTHYF